MEFIAAKCPQCGADLQVPDNKDFVYCLYCGSNIKVRDAVLIKDNVNIENFIEIAYEAIKNRNFMEANEYLNRVHEIDINNVKAWWGKAGTSINSSTGYDTLISAGINYAKKAYDLADEKDKAEIKEKMIAELCGHDLWSSHIDSLFLLFDEFGQDDIRPLKKIVDICNKNIYSSLKPHPDSNKLFEHRSRAMNLIMKMDSKSYSQLETKCKQLENGRIEQIKSIRVVLVSRKISDLNDKYLMGNVIFSAILALIIGAYFSTLNSLKDIWFLFSVVIFTLYCLIYYSLIKGEAEKSISDSDVINY